MKIAVPMLDGGFCAHFGQSGEFALFEVDDRGDAVLSRQDLAAPVHEHGTFPEWLSTHGVTHVLAGGLGARAEELLSASGISVVAGVAPDDPAALVDSYLSGKLVPGANGCGTDHACSH